MIKTHMTNKTNNSLRPIRSDDLPELVAVVNRRIHASGLRVNMQADELGEDLESSRTRMEHDTRVAIDDSGRIVGYAWTLNLPSDSSDERCYVEGGVDPEHRGRGVGRSLMEWSVEHAHELLAASPNDRAKYVRIHHGVDDESTRRLSARFGFAPIRWFEDLVRPLADVPDPIDVPGVRIEPWPAADPLLDEIRSAKNTSFLDHWGSAPMTAEGWREHILGYGSRLDLSFVARDTTTGRVVAHLFSTRYPADDEIVGRRQAWVDNLGTLREWRGRGVASALIGAALRAYRDDGLSHAMIGVDADSPTGASRLYRSLGFELEARFVDAQIDHSARLPS
ncbi:MAG: GNAT family N-acetyltransferase [Acidimicrobiales bacterium mtb01]|nr:GNAT family N-acetyltransferase [Actinomycetota bacterium]TEX44819.1 MAG: GNAT family N-acetyltransferase [Acidimicrobiales bacterium mtb01]